MTDAATKPPKLSRRALQRAQRLATHLAALPLERAALPRFRRLARELLDALDEGRVLPPERRCDDCDELLAECCC